MTDVTSNTYKGWNIQVVKSQEMCSKFSFDITDPCGKTQHVRLGGDSAMRAMERAREMIDLELSFGPSRCSSSH